MNEQERRAQSLADGPAGTVLLERERGTCCPDGIRTMLSTPVRAHPEQATLFEGAPAVAFALAANGPSRALTTLDGHIETITRSRLDAAHCRIDHGELPDKGEYDLMAGLTGLGTYLLRRHGPGPLLRDVLTYLVRLTEPRPDGLPGWWAAHGPTGAERGWDGGHGNLGISHGIAGPLALLAQTARAGIHVAGQSHALSRILTWLDQWRHDTESGTWWPGVLSRAEHDDGQAQRQAPPRPSWCYGTPGIARAQHLAGLALGDTERQHRTENTLAGCLADNGQLAQFTDVSLCHGWAGLLHTTWRMSQHAPRLRAHLPMLIERLTNRLDEHYSPGAGLLTGEAGARLALHTATTDQVPVTRWDACLLLDG
ncbi:lanthionine synthetase C family protein [Actinopolyspora halophila]|uniref:lanthionine synthetase C family protein n=1 Tax=Actinopolyspora halophila TaxID=1850 RepID=UPI0003727F97|nr:lanthionine synthetase C family protein [Actinopolyspora halophila]